MYSHFTDRACRVLLEMQSEASIFEHDHTGTEHLLVAIAEVDDSVSGPVLRRFGLTAEGIRQVVQAVDSPGVDQGSGSSFRVFKASDATEDIPAAPLAAEAIASPPEFTPKLLKCLMTLAPFEAHELGDDHVGPEHFLIALLRTGEDVTNRVLEDLGVEAADLMRAVYERIVEDPGAGDNAGPVPSEAERQATLDRRRMAAEFRMNPDDRVVFTSDGASQVFCLLDALYRLYNSEHRDDVIEQVTGLISESFRRKAGSPTRMTPSQFTPAQERQIVASIVGGLREIAADQLGI